MLPWADGDYWGGMSKFLERKMKFFKVFLWSCRIEAIRFSALLLQSSHSMPRLQKSSIRYHLNFLKKSSIRYLEVLSVKEKEYANDHLPVGRNVLCSFSTFPHCSKQTFEESQCNKSSKNLGYSQLKVKETSYRLLFLSLQKTFFVWCLVRDSCKT